MLAKSCPYGNQHFTSSVKPKHETWWEVERDEDNERIKKGKIKQENKRLWVGKETENRGGGGGAGGAGEDSWWMSLLMPSEDLAAPGTRAAQQCRFNPFFEELGSIQFLIYSIMQQDQRNCSNPRDLFTLVERSNKLHLNSSVFRPKRYT